MDHYIDIRITPSAELLENMVMNEVFFRLHKGLVEMGQRKIGISFPEVGKTLGNCLRLHGSQLSLQQLMAAAWRKDIEDYSTISNMALIPTVASHRVVKRVQVKSSSERLMRRSLRKGWITQEEAEKKLKDSKPKITLLPYIRLKSLSTGNTFCLFVEHGQLVANPVAGEFTSYGLSSTATVPWF